jgi:tRNA pseudouridine38-40 synthase
VKLTLEYDGTDFFGWQRLGEGKTTIQGVLEEHISELFGRHIAVAGASRTDRGVHALRQVATFIPPRSVERYNLPHALQSLVDHRISVKKVEVMPEGFHAQYNARGKRYVYRIWNAPRPSGLRGRFSHWVRQPLDLDLLNQTAQALIGVHDFESFRSEGSIVNSTVREVKAAKWSKKGSYVQFEIVGTGFLKQMVRNIVGTCIEVSQGKRSVESIPDLLLARDRRLAGHTVPAAGLFLTKVFYEMNDLERQSALTMKDPRR